MEYESEDIIKEMAKDGTRRGGARAGAGRPRKSLSEKIASGKTKGVTILPPPPDFEGVEMPPPRDYLMARQRDGKPFYAEEIYVEIWQWLKKYGCESLINKQILEHYAQMSARQIQCEEALTEYGMLAKHPTTGAAIASPYVTMSMEYMKQVNSLWSQIYRIVKENCEELYEGEKTDDAMRQLLLAKIPKKKR